MFQVTGKAMIAKMRPRILAVLPQVSTKSNHHPLEACRSANNRKAILAVLHCELPYLPSSDYPFRLSRGIALEITQGHSVNLPAPILLRRPAPPRLGCRP